MAIRKYKTQRKQSAGAGRARGGQKKPAAPKIFRVIVPVGDIECATEFYSTLLNTNGLRVSLGRHYILCGGVVLALYDPMMEDRRTFQPNPDHVYFAVRNLEAAYARAKKLNCLSSEIGDGKLPMGEIRKRPWGERSFYARDPFGNPLCFVDEATLYRG
ncbi:MAG TPA: VOC family protein [Candidatus Nitrosotenuis sp.]|nr:VOC family protein [Candidatus Nitrosotenuis sp.]